MEPIRPSRQRQAFDLTPPALLRNVRVVLVDPEVPGNIGATARAMKTMGLSHLTVVGGSDFRDHAEARKMAHRAWEVLESARRVGDFPPALAECHYVVGTTHRHRGGHLPRIQPAREAAREIAARARHGPVAVVFGTEEHGLTDDLLQQCNALASIPTAVREPSLNLAQAVMVFCYEIFLAALETPLSRRLDLATHEEMERLYSRALATLQAIGFRPHHGRPESFKRAMRRVFGRSPLEKQDLRLLHRIFQQMDFYVAKHRPS